MSNAEPVCSVRKHLTRVCDADLHVWISSLADCVCSAGDHRRRSSGWACRHSNAAHVPLYHCQVYRCGTSVRVQWNISQFIVNVHCLSCDARHPQCQRWCCVFRQRGRHCFCGVLCLRGLTGTERVAFAWHTTVDPPKTLLNIHHFVWLYRLTHAESPTV